MSQLVSGLLVRAVSRLTSKWSSKVVINGKVFNTIPTSSYTPSILHGGRLVQRGIPRRTQGIQRRCYSDQAKPENKPPDDVDELKKQIAMMKRASSVAPDPIRQFLRGEFSWKNKQEWIPLLFTFTTVSLVAWYIHKSHSKKSPPKPIAEPVVNVLRLIPTRTLSRLWGWFVSIPIPTILRPTVYNLYAAIFDANVSEAEKPLEEYRSIGEFFARRLKPGVRPVCRHVDMVSPVDGRVLHFGQVKGSWGEQVKGIYYSLEAFLGPDAANLISELSKEQFFTGLQFETPRYPSIGLEGSKSALYFIVIYLAPGDYHGIHSPVEWRITDTRHFPGDLFSVSPSAARMIQGLFTINERVVIAGHWPYGFFSLTPVGAYNVGSIELSFDKSVKTNRWGQTASRREQNTVLMRGDEVGFFHMGSTVVLIFEAPDFVFRVYRGQKVKMGEMIGEVPNEINGRRLAFERIFTRRWLKQRRGTSELAFKTYKELFANAAAAAASAVKSGAASFKEVVPPLFPSEVKNVVEEQVRLKQLMAMEDLVAKDPTAEREYLEQRPRDPTVEIPARLLPGAMNMPSEGEYKGVQYTMTGTGEPYGQEDWPAPDEMEDNLDDFAGLFGGRWPPSRDEESEWPPKPVPRPTKKRHDNV